MYINKKSQEIQSQRDLVDSISTRTKYGFLVDDEPVLVAEGLTARPLALVA